MTRRCQGRGTPGRTSDYRLVILDVLLGAGSALAGVRLDGPAVVGVVGRGFEGAEPGVAATANAAIDALAGPGLRLVDAPRPVAADLELANAAGLVASRSEAAAFHRSLDADRSLYWEEVAPPVVRTC